VQSLTWYARRLRAMAPAEILWRLHGAGRDAIDRVRLRTGWSPGVRRWPSHADSRPRFRLTDVPVGELRQNAIGRAAFLRSLLARADAVCAHRLEFLSLEGVDAGPAIDWNRDYERGTRAPLVFSGSIDYRDPERAGDAKLVWELNRHHELVVLARAYRATGDSRYAAEIVAQLESWVEQCPFGRGMNWRSPLELGIRVINWAWALDFVEESGLVGAAVRERVQRAVNQHVWDISRKYSRGSSANNHRIGEAAAVFIATSYFDVPRREARRRAAQKILLHEIVSQTFADGGTREQAFGYHLFVIQFFLLAGLIARRSGEDMPAYYWERLERMLEFAGVLCEAGDPPAFGDADEGRVLDLGGGNDARWLLAVGAVLFGRGDFKRWSGGEAEAVLWLLGTEGRRAFEALPSGPAVSALTSRGFPDSGRYLLQSGQHGADDSMSVLFDCGAMGFPPLVAHGHADALSFALRVGGADLLVDPGTYDYFSFPKYRAYFRSSAAHNTVVVDGRDQARMVGSFLWDKPVRAWCVTWQPSACGGMVTGQHDGYLSLADPVTHRRTLVLNGTTLEIRDELLAGGRHDVTLNFHVARLGVHAIAKGSNTFAMGHGDTGVLLTVDPRLAVTILTGRDAPIAGWMSRGYHRKQPCTTLVCSGEIDGSAYFECHVEVKGGRTSAASRDASRPALANAARRSARP